MNKIWLEGRVSSEVNVSSGASDDARWKYAKFDLAVPRVIGGRRTKQQQEKDFFTIQASGKYADVVQDYVVTGMKLSIAGEIHLESFKNRKTGFTMQKPLVHVERLEFSESRKVFDAWQNSEEGQKFFAEDARIPDYINTDAPEIADFPVNEDGELPFG